MNRTQAAAILGIEANAPVAEARKAYLARARLLHPDRFAGGTQDEIRSATEAMSQLNAAWEVFENPSTASSEDTPRSAPTNDGLPIWRDPRTACDICGWGPATDVTFNSVTGLILFWRWFTFRATLCHLCGVAMYNENQRSTLLKGWWGIIAPIATVIAFILNISRVGSIKRLPLPQGRYPGAVTLSRAPLLFSTPWWKRPASLLATGVALFFIASIVSSILVESSSPSTNRPPSSPSSNNSGVNSGNSGLLNACFTEVEGNQLQDVDCSSSLVNWRGSREVPTPSGATECPMGYVREGSWDICLVKVN